MTDLLLVPGYGWLVDMGLPGPCTQLTLTTHIQSNILTQLSSFLILNMDITTDNSSDFENENRQLLSSFEFLPILASVAASLTIGIISNKVMLG